MTSHPIDWNILLKIPIAASWPSKIAAAVMILSGVLPASADFCMYSGYYLPHLIRRLKIMAITINNNCVFH
jgi:hypothetical protein